MDFLNCPEYMRQVRVSPFIKDVAHINSPTTDNKRKGKISGTY